MPHGPHRHTDIATQAGLSVATVDRVLNGRPAVSARAVRAVEHAVLELDRQQTQLRLGARSLVLDLVIQAPDRFSSVVRQALEAELPGLRPATVRARFHQRERGSVAELVRTLDGIGRRGRASDGLLLKAPDVAEVVEAIDALDQRGIPVVTLSRTDFFGERERLAQFERVMASSDPHRDVIVLADADGLDDGMTGLMRDLVTQRQDIAAVYSAGGGNRGIAAVLADAGLAPVHLGHDLDDDNLALLRDGTLDAVLHHDLRADVARAARQLLRAHRLLPGAPTSYAAPVQVVTPHNIPLRRPPTG